MGRPATAKKDQLIDAAMVRFHHHGVAASSLAAVANDAGVPAGNVYYYFQTKDQLTDAVVDRWCDRAADSLAAHETYPDPFDRLRAFIARAGDNSQAYADHACPLAAIAGHSGRPLDVVRGWIVEQFALVDSTDAQARADFLFASLQGSFALAHTARDPAIIAHNVAHLTDWIDRLSAPI